jgi:peptide methionine sulfoxide reductase MsrA
MSCPPPPSAAGIYTHTPEQLEEAGKYLEEKRGSLPGVKIVTELEPINMYFKAEVCVG